MKRLVVVLMAAALAVSCGSSGGDGGGGGGGGGGGEQGCVATLPGCESAVCVGNSVRSCNEEGTAYQYELCWGQACRNGMCQNAACLEPDKRTCTSTQGYDLCLPDMSMVTPKECPGGTACAAGACPAVPCTAGKKACGWKAVLTCKEDGSGYTVEACGDGQYCDETAATCVDIDPFCLDNPLGARCQDLAVSLQCQNSGKLLPSDCKKDEVCDGGYCQPKVCGANYSGGGGSDAAGQTDSAGLQDQGGGGEEDMVTIELAKPEIPPLEKTPLAQVTLNGGEFDMWTVKFSSNKKANYVYKDKTLQVAMAKGPYLMEVHFQGIEEGVVGNFSSEEPGSVNVMILLNDGTTEQEVVQWKWGSVGFNATLNQFDPAGGWVKGTFAGVLEQAGETGGGPPVEVLNGSFDVPRNQ